MVYKFDRRYDVKYGDCFPFLCKIEQFKEDTILIPKETAWFGYYPDGTFDSVLPPQEVTLQLRNLVSLSLA